MKKISILAVNDPAVQAYVDPDINIIKEIESALHCQLSIDIIDFVDYYDRLMQAFETGDYDIVMVAGHLWLASFIEKGYLSPIEIQPSASYDYEDVLKRIREEMCYQGQQYLLPSFCDGHMVLYRRPAFVEAFNTVVTPMDIQLTLEKEFDKTLAPFVLKAHPSEVFLDVLPYFRAYDVEPFDAKGQPTFNTQAGYQAVKSYKAMLQYCPSETLSYGNDEVKKALQEKACTIGITWGGQLGAVMNHQCIDPETIAFSVLKKPWNVTWSFGLNHKSQKQDLAVAVMQLLTIKEIDREVGRICGNPTRYANFDEDRKHYSWYTQVQHMIENYVPLSSFPQLPEAIEIVTRALTDILEDKVTVEQGLSSADQELRGIL
jgi:multiple sugar transport system substrate-binding protein